MSKGDWEVYDDENVTRVETPVNEMTACQMYGHSFETVVDDEGEPIPFGFEFMRKCNDCGETYTYDPQDETEITG